MQNTDGMEELEINLLILLTNKQTCFLHSTSWIFWYTRTGRYKSGNLIGTDIQHFSFEGKLPFFHCFQWDHFQAASSKGFGIWSLQICALWHEASLKNPKIGGLSTEFYHKTINQSINQSSIKQSRWLGGSSTDSYYQNIRISLFQIYHLYFLHCTSSNIQ